MSFSLYSLYYTKKRKNRLVFLLDPRIMNLTSIKGCASMNQLSEEQKHLSIIYRQLLARKDKLTRFLTERRAAHLQDLRHAGTDVRLNFDSVTDSLDTYAAIESKNREIDQMNLSLAAAEKELAAVERLLKSPYFGKLSMRFTEETTDETFYIGVNGFTDEQKNGLIYDWRSPIAAVFYENNLGPASYTVNDQQLKVFVNNRWQFMIDHQQLIQMFDTTTAIQDDVLLAALASDHAQEMKDITASIQKEQNKIIRDAMHRHILVHGVAGSGKTSVAMQRVAFLLYHYRQQITADNFMILSPNKDFTQYISQVLPALGEKNPRTLTLNQLIGQLSDFSAENETNFFANRQQVPSKEIQVLRQHDFISYLKGHAVKPAGEKKVTFLPICYKDKVIFSRATLEALYRTTPEKYSIQERLQGVKQKLISLWHRRLEKNAKKSQIYDQVLALTEEQQQKMLGRLIADEQVTTIRQAAYTLLKRKYNMVDCAIDDLSWFDHQSFAADLFRQYSHYPLTTASQHSDTDHQIFYLIIKHLFVQKIDVPKLSYLLIDEVQDYTPAQIDFLLLLFPHAAFTLVGDENQAIFQTSTPFDEIKDLFIQAGLPLYRYDLSTSYRSSGTITALFAKLQTKNIPIKISAVRPLGYEVSFLDYLPNDALIKQIKDRKIPLTILTKSETEAALLRNKLDGVTLQTQISVMPIHLAKGREFQHVILYNVNNQNYHSPLDQRILYTAISRATETLMITSDCSISSLILKKTSTSS